MFVAYLVPKFDTHLVYEDGLGFLAKGNTAEEAKAALLAQLESYDAEEKADVLEEHKMFVVEL